MENEEMTNDAAVAGLVTGYLPMSRSVEIRLDGPIPPWVEVLPRRAYLASGEELDAVGREGEGHNADWCAGWNARNLAEAQDATTVAELQAEVERLQVLSAAISRDCNECANQRNEANAKAAAAERRVAELYGVLSDTVGGLYRIDINRLDAGETHKLDVLLDRLQTALSKETP